MLMCNEVTELADAHLERRLPWRKRMQMKLHLMMCRNCRNYMDQLARTVTLLRSTAPAPLDAEATDAVLAAVRARQARGDMPE